MLGAIIVAGGSSRRMGFDKVLAIIGNKPVVAHSIAAFEATASVKEIILVGREKRLGELADIVSAEKFEKVRAIVAGGTHRQDSVSQGLERLSHDMKYVAVHDAARPLVTPAQTELVFQEARAHGAATLAAPVTDTLKRATNEYVVCESIARAGVYAMQTPQIFLRELLVEAFRVAQAEKLSMTDEVSAVEHLRREVVLVANSEPNFKITYPADLALAECALHERARNSRERDSDARR